jgi:RNA polymerase primary sigma factor
MNRTLSNLEQKFQREPSMEELGEVLRLTPEQITDTLQMGNRQISIDAPFVQGEENGLLDVMKDDLEQTPDSELIHNSLRQDVQRSLSTLTARESDIISLYYGLNCHAMTLDEIAIQFDLTRERVRQIKEKGLRRLRQTSRSKVLKEYLG